MNTSKIKDPLQRAILKTGARGEASARDIFNVGDRVILKNTDMTRSTETQGQKGIVVGFPPENDYAVQVELDAGPTWYQCGRGIHMSHVETIDEVEA